MPTRIAKHDIQMPLRRQAETLLLRGAAPAARIAVTGTEALAALHDMALVPETAGTALKLLHELQVHQVELDLQHEHLEQTRNELAVELDRRLEHYNFAPIGYFILDPQGTIIEGNRAGADLLGLEQAALCGQRMERLVSPCSRLDMIEMLKRLTSSGSKEICMIHVSSQTATSRLFRVIASVSPNDRSLMMMFVEWTDHHASGSSSPS